MCDSQSLCFPLYLSVLDSFENLMLHVHIRRKEGGSVVSQTNWIQDEVIYPLGISLCSYMLCYHYTYLTFVCASVRDERSLEVDLTWKLRLGLLQIFLRYIKYYVTINEKQH